MANEYIEAADLTGMLVSPNEAVLDACITAASRLIDNYCERVFYTSETSKTYDASNNTILLDDLISVTSLALDTTTLTVTTDYTLYPQNETPKEQAVLTSTGTALVVTGTFGYASSIPDEITMACKFIAKRMYLTAMGADNIKSEKTATYAVTYDLSNQLTQTEELLLNSYRKYRRGQL